MVRFHICSVWETLIWNQWPFLTGISQTINHLQYRFFTGRTHKRCHWKSQVHEPPWSYEHADISKQKSTSSKPVVRSDMHQHPSKGRVHWFHLRMESNKTITCTKWSNQVKLIQTINRINSKSSARDQKFSVGNLHSFHGIGDRVASRSSCPANLQVFLTAFSTCKPNAHRSLRTRRANHSTFT